MTRYAQDCAFGSPALALFPGSRMIPDNEAAGETPQAISDAHFRVVGQQNHIYRKRLRLTKVDPSGMVEERHFQVEKLHKRWMEAAIC